MWGRLFSDLRSTDAISELVAPLLYLQKWKRRREWEGRNEREGEKEKERGREKEKERGKEREREGEGLLTISFIRSHVWCNYLFPRSGPIEIPHRQLYPMIQPSQANQAKGGGWHCFFFKHITIHEFWWWLLWIPNMQNAVMIFVSLYWNIFFW